MIFTERPSKFNPIFEIVSCFVMVDGKFVVLKRLENKSEGGKWGLPAGKIDPNEDLYDAVRREVFEETGLKLDISESDFNKTVFVKHDETGKEIIFHMFTKILDEVPEIKLSPTEHSEYKFVTPAESFEINFVHDLDSCVKLIFRI